MRILFTFLLFTSICFLNQAQTKSQKVTYLNQHFYEISGKDSENRAFQQVENEIQNGEKLVLIFDLENRLIAQAKKSFNETEKFNQEIRDHFDTQNNLQNQTLKNLDNGRYATSFFENGQKKGQVIYLGDQSFTLWRESPESEKLKNRDDFKPGLDMERLQELFAQNLQYPISARRLGQSGTVQIALLISETGKLKEIEPANAYGMNKELVKEALRVIQLYDGPFFPALDLQGNPIEAWMYVPVRFKLG